MWQLSLVLIFCMLALAHEFANADINSSNFTQNDELVFTDKIERIDNTPLKGSSKNWIVTFQIDSLITGNYPNKTFSFRIHSPAQSTLEVGKVYRVKATKISSKYEVDEQQWSRH